MSAPVYNNDGHFLEHLPYIDSDRRLCTPFLRLLINDWQADRKMIPPVCTIVISHDKRRIL